MRIEGSSHLEAAHYDSAKRVLSISFKSGRTYDYMNVPPEKWQAFQEAESKGKYLHSEINPHHRSWQRPTPKTDTIPL